MSVSPIYFSSYGIVTIFMNTHIRFVVYSLEKITKTDRLKSLQWLHQERLLAFCTSIFPWKNIERTVEAGKRLKYSQRATLIIAWHSQGLDYPSVILCFPQLVFCRYFLVDISSLVKNTHGPCGAKYGFFLLWPKKHVATYSVICTFIMHAFYYTPTEIEYCS